jgi:hypothetical protein
MKGKHTSDECKKYFFPLFNNIPSEAFTLRDIISFMAKLFPN